MHGRAGSAAAPAARCRKFRRGSFIMSPSDNLLRFDARSLDDRPPLRDFGFLHRGERLGRLLLARRNDKALVDKFLAHGGIVRCANGGGVELVDDVPRRALRGEQTRPQRKLEPGEPTSSADGISGAIAMRSLVVTANALTLPARTCGIAVAVLEIDMSICPAIRSCTDGLTPR